MTEPRHPPSAIRYHCPMNVIKVGGSLAGIDGALRRVGMRIAALAQRNRWVVIPGGGPFADSVRSFAEQHPLSPTAAHWMAILGMDQYAFALAEQIPGGRVVDDQLGIQQAWTDGAVPVLAPSRWLRAADELPHRWEVTSDSLAAYLAMLLGAERLVLVKAKAGGRELADGYFDRALPVGLGTDFVSIEELERLMTDGG
jgi:5-(aminomethyl)-3-furanmethanol phosphate kinase